MDKQENDRQTGTIMVTDMLKRIVRIASGDEPAYAHLTGAQRFRLIADGAQMVLDIWLEPIPDPKWSKPIGGPGRPFCLNCGVEMVPQLTPFGGNVYLCPRCGAINMPPDDPAHQDAENGSGKSD